MVISAINRNHHKELSLTFLIICGICLNALMHVKVYTTCLKMMSNTLNPMENMHGDKPKVPQESHTRSHAFVLCILLTC